MDQSWNRHSWWSAMQEMKEKIDFLELENLRLKYERDLAELRLRWSREEDFDDESQSSWKSEISETETDRWMRSETNEHLELFDASVPDLIDLFSEPPPGRLVNGDCEQVQCRIDDLLAMDVSEKLIHLCKNTAYKAISSFGSSEDVNRGRVENKIFRKRQKKKKKKQMNLRKNRKETRDKELNSSLMNFFQSTSPPLTPNVQRKAVQEAHNRMSKQRLKNNELSRRGPKRWLDSVTLDAQQERERNDDGVKLRKISSKNHSMTVTRKNFDLVRRLPAKDLKKLRCVLKYHYQGSVFCKMKIKKQTDARPLQSWNETDKMVPRDPQLHPLDLDDSSTGTELISTNPKKLLKNPLMTSRRTSRDDNDADGKRTTPYLDRLEGLHLRKSFDWNMKTKMRALRIVISSLDI